LERFEAKRAELAANGARLAAISVDPVDQSQEMADDHELRFPILADESGETIKAFGVWHAAKKIALPAVFVIDRERTIRWRYVSGSVTDRPPEEDVVGEVKKLRR